MLRRVVVVSALAAGLVAVSAAHASGQKVAEPKVAEPGSAERGQGAHWVAAEIERVVAAGLMAGSVETFRPDELLTWGELATVLADVGGRQITVKDPARPVTLTQLNTQLVKALGMSSEIKTVRRALAAARLSAPRRAAPETVARLLRLRTDREDDARELRPGDPVTRAEAAYSIARVLSIQPWELERVRQLIQPFSLPELSELQRKILMRGVRVIGFPYVWGGTSVRQQASLGGQLVPGGFDCSGLIWHVYKSKPFAGAPGLGDVLHGRSTYALSGEVGNELRITRDAIEPADLLFFGPRGPGSSPDEVGHMGIYLGGGWMIHSSTFGATIIPLTAWYENRFAWARRPLAEAGLA
ncbi:MAG: C40 family peptidase [Actinomycetia bacterium]|nr:C40 family peptidase [Actinomycetes bacterium]